MSEVAEYRFTDRQVRGSSLLQQAAEEFLHLYKGDFEFLRNAKIYLDGAGYLPTAMARGVLNCMRTDPQGQELLRAIGEVFHLAPEPVREGRVIRLPRPPYIDLPCVWRYDYIMSLHKLASVVHILDKERSTIRYYPYTGEFRPRIQVCKYLYSLDKYRMIDHIPSDRALCRQCERRIAV